MSESFPSDSQLAISGARKAIIDEITSKARIVMVIGRVDTGKSHFCRQLALSGLEKGLKVAIVDSDPGQSWIGPPSTVGVKLIQDYPHPTVFPDSLYFIGSLSPERHLLQSVVGTKKMVEKAQSLGADLIIIDTSGLVDGKIGRSLKLSKIEATRPDHLVCFQRYGELETLIRGVEQVLCKVHRLVPSRFVERKDHRFRCLYRNKQFGEYFSNFILEDIYFDKVRGQRDVFLNGRRANPEELIRISDILGVNIYYAEWFFRGLTIFPSEEIDQLAIGSLCDQLRIDELVIRRREGIIKTIVGLVDETGETFSLAIVEDLDFKSNKMTIRCPKHSAERVRAIQFSGLKVPEEVCLGEVREDKRVSEAY